MSGERCMLYCASTPTPRSRPRRRRRMATQTESVVTPERFAQGISYKTWMETIDRNQQRFVENYDGFTPDPADIEKIKGLVAKGVTRCLALGEPWCPDVFRG